MTDNAMFKRTDRLIISTDYQQVNPDINYQKF